MFLNQRKESPVIKTWKKTDKLEKKFLNYDN